MKDFKWLVAVMSETCVMCSSTIRQGDGFYFEATERKPHCRECGRLIRVVGYDNALRTRNPLGSFGDFFKGMF